MIAITDPEIRCDADRAGAETHEVRSFDYAAGGLSGKFLEFSVLTHGGRSRAQELADAYTVPETGDDLGATDGVQKNLI